MQHVVLRRAMIRHRVFSVLIAFTLSVQLVPAGAGLACLAPSGASANARMGDDMAGMGIDVRSVAHGVTNAGKHVSVPKQHRSRGIPCERAPASASCQLFASCAGGFMAADPRIGGAPHLAPSTVPVIELLTPASRSVAPELPPPRA